MADVPEVINVPVFSGSSVQVSSNGNEVMLLFSALAPTADDAKSVMRAVAAVTMPRGTAHDLAHVLSGIVAQLDEALGPIDTPYQKEQREGAQ